MLPNYALCQYLTNRFFSAYDAKAEVCGLPPLARSFASWLMLSLLSMSNHLNEVRPLRKAKDLNLAVRQISLLDEYIPDFYRLEGNYNREALSDADLKRIIVMLSKVGSKNDEFPQSAFHQALCLMDRCIDYQIDCQTQTAKDREEVLSSLLLEAGSPSTFTRMCIQAHHDLTYVLTALSQKDGIDELPVTGILRPAVLPPEKPVQLRAMTAALGRFTKRTKVLFSYLHNGLLRLALGDDRDAAATAVRLGQSTQELSSGELEIIRAQLTASSLGKQVFARDARSFNAETEELDHAFALLDAVFQTETGAPLRDALLILVRVIEIRYGLSIGNLNGFAAADVPDSDITILEAACISLPPIRALTKVTPTDSVVSEDAQILAEAWAYIATKLAASDRKQLAAYLRRAADVYSILLADPVFREHYIGSMSELNSGFESALPVFTSVIAELRERCRATVRAAASEHAVLLPSASRPLCLFSTYFSSFADRVSDVVRSIPNERARLIITNILAVMAGIPTAVREAAGNPSLSVPKPLFDSLQQGTDYAVFEALDLLAKRSVPSSSPAGTAPAKKTVDEIRSEKAKRENARRARKAAKIAERQPSLFDDI